VPPRVKTPEGLLRSVLFSDANHVSACLEGTVNGAGSALDWFRDHSGIDAERALASLPTRAPDDLPLFLNGVGGLGSPFWVANAPIEFIGHEDDVERLMAILESIAFLLDANLRAIRSVAPITRVVVRLPVPGARGRVRSRGGAVCSARSNGTRGRVSRGRPAHALGRAGPRSGFRGDQAVEAYGARQALAQGARPATCCALVS
jgi:glycerol kinase